MKFPHLPIGHRFSYKGKTYSKIGPLTANDEETGKRQLIMKSAEVTPLDFAEQPAERKARQYSESEVKEMFYRYREQLRMAFLAQADQHEVPSIEQLLELLDEQRLPVD